MAQISDIHSARLRFSPLPVGSLHICIGNLAKQCTRTARGNMQLNMHGGARRLVRTRTHIAALPLTVNNGNLCILCTGPKTALTCHRNWGNKNENNSSSRLFKKENKTRHEKTAEPEKHLLSRNKQNNRGRTSSGVGGLGKHAQYLTWRPPKHNSLAEWDHFIFFSHAHPGLEV